MYENFTSFGFEDQVTILRILNERNKLNMNLSKLAFIVNGSVLRINKRGDDINCIGFKRRNAEAMTEAKTPVNVFNSDLYEKAMTSSRVIEKGFTLKTFDDNGLFRVANRLFLAKELRNGALIYSIVNVDNSKGQRFTEMNGFVKAASFLQNDEHLLYLNVHPESCRNRR